MTANLLRAASSIRPQSNPESHDSRKFRSIVNVVIFIVIFYIAPMARSIGSITLRTKIGWNSQYAGPPAMIAV